MTHSQKTARSLAAIPWYRTFAAALLRLAIGWHFLYEGVVKLMDPEWTAAGYLSASTGPLAGVFRGLAADATVLGIVDLLNTWGLILIGASLMLGLLTRLTAVSGIVLLTLYYISNPPWFGPPALGPSEGHYLFVNKNLIELLALWVVFAFPATFCGLDGILSGLLKRRTSRRVAPASTAGQAEPCTHADLDRLTRRQIMAGLMGAPVAGGFALAVLRQQGWHSHEESQLAASANASGDVDAVTGATRTFNWASLDELKGKVPTAKIGNLELSRLIMGGNLIGGWAHARDLIYVSKLIKAYHHREKVFETLRLAEACGVNTILTSPTLCEVISDYWQNGGGNIQFISDCGGGNLLEMIQRSIDVGASACYVHGAVADGAVRKGDFGKIEKALELIRRNELPAGIGGHSLATIQGCAQQGLQPDFWMKTLHHGDYWSATPTPRNDNIWCARPEETAAFMKDRPEPWIAYKTLAAGAILPEDGFKYAFENGADFICVGMYDFQVVDDANIACGVLDGDLDRQRPWYA